MTPCRAAIAALAVLVACSHDTERANPLDPELTPPVDLAIAVDDTAGLARLTWSAYSGKAAFDRYLVLRQVFDRQSVNTLASLPDVATMAWIDTTLDPDKVYVYRVSVVNTEGAEVTSIEQSVSPLSLPTADILSHEFDSGSASASLIWSAYPGPRFHAYQVERTTTTTRVIVHETQDIADTSWTDTRLRGATEYEYRIAVVTQRGERILGNGVGGAIYAYVEQWPFEGRYARLLEDGGTIIGVRTGTEGDGWFRISRFDQTGAMLADVRRDWPMPFGINIASVAPRNDGWLLAMASVWSLDAAGEMPYHEIPVVSSDSLFTLEPEHRQVSPTLALHGSVEPGRGWYDRVRWQLDDEPWQEIDLGADDGYEFLRSRPLPLPVHLGDVPTDSFQLIVDAFTDDGVSVTFGGVTHSRFGFYADRSLGTLFRWNYVPPSGTAGVATSAEIGLSFPFVEMRALPNRVAMELEDGVLRVSLAQPDPWWQRGPSQLAHVITPVEGGWLVSGVAAALFLAENGTATQMTPLDDWVRELRTWDAGRGTGIGVCLPAANKLILGSLFGAGATNWTTRLVNEIGPWLGEGIEPLFYPLSFDVGADGRIYVLEGGSARVLVFDRDRNYITEFGSRGAEPGRFDTGHGGEIAAEGERFFYGSVAVDDDGFIYVADMGNNRIQKFSP